MPIYSDYEENNDARINVMCYGDAKTRKTTWAMQAAEMGYDVLFLNGDQGQDIITNNFSKEAKRRIRMIELQPKQGNGSIMTLFLAHLLKGNDIIWNDTTREIVSRMRPESGHDYFLISPRKLTNNTVLVLDSWTALVTSTISRISDEKNIDLSEVAKLEWTQYGPSGMYLDWAIEQFKALNSHNIVIAHAQTIDKYKQDPTDNKKMVLVSSKTKPISSSKNHSEKIAKYFDILYFKMIGNQFYVDASADQNRDGGSRIIPPKNYSFAELGFKEYAALAKIAPPIKDGVMAGCELVRAADVADYYSKSASPAPSQTVGTPVLQSQPSQIKPALGFNLKK